MAVSFFNTIILLGALQGAIVSTLLFLSKKNKRPNRILAVLIVLISMASFNLYGSYKDWLGLPLLRFIFTIVPLVIVMPVGPLLYFYTRAYLEPSFRITKKQRWHFLPVLIDLVPGFTACIYLTLLLLKWVKNNPEPWGIFIDSYNVYADIPRWLSVSFYLWRAYACLRRMQLKNELGLQVQPADFKWLQQFIRAFSIFQGIWLLYLIPYVIPRYTDWVLDHFSWYPVYIPLSILIYWLGIRGWMVAQERAVKDRKPASTGALLSPELVQQATATLKKAMEEDQLFLDARLNLAALAASTGLTQKTVSAVLNQYMQTNFTDFVNGYRVNAFKQKILQPETNHLTLAGIALECGFNSQATFQRTFKEITGLSPTQYRKNSAAR